MKQRLKLTSSQSFNHYSGVGILLLIPIFLISSIMETNIGNRTFTEIIIVIFLSVIPAIVLFIIQFSKLRYREITVKISNEDLKRVIEITIRQLDWKIFRYDNDLICAYRYSNGDHSKKELIIIKKTSKSVFVNSINDPDNIISVLAFGRNKRNVKSFIQNLRHFEKNISVPTTKRVKENELSGRKIFKRLVVYPLCILMILGCIITIYDAVSPRLMFGGIIIIVLIVIYLSTDIALILKQIYARKHNKQ